MNYDIASKKVVNEDLLSDKQMKEVLPKEYQAEKWAKITDLLDYDKQKAFYESQNLQNVVDTKNKPSMKITKEEKEINGYKCKKAIVVDFGVTYTVWFTEAMNYNWLFMDYLYKVPGTAVLVESEEKVVLELKSVNKIDYSKSELKADDILNLMSFWK